MHPERQPEEFEEHTLLPFFVIAIGASAGGLSAIKSFVRNVPDNYPHAIVIIQHLSDDYKSMMSELLAVETSLPINEVTDTLTLEGGHIYLMPPNHNILLEGLDSEGAHDPQFVFTPKTPKPGLNLPIDLFFHSMAHTVKSRAIGVVLSGTGGDGSQGLRAIKAMDGIVLVQEPQTAEFDGMPFSAINTQLVDFVMSPDQMPGEIQRYIMSIRTGSRNFELALEKDNAALLRMVTIAGEKANANFSGYKKPMLQRRIAKRMSMTGCHGIVEYEKLLNEDLQEQEKLYQEFLVGVTYFFRDPAAWEVLAKQVIPTMLGSEKESIKVWSCGCSTGEEAYTLAMLLDEYVEEHGITSKIMIYATDIDEQALSVAQRGVYPPSIEESVSPERLKKYFNPCSGGYEVSTKLRKMVIFSKHNMIESPPYIHVDLLVCRNVLIYLSSVLQNQLLGAFTFSLVRNGVLFLGPSESLGEHENRYGQIDRSWRIFSNRKVPMLRSEVGKNFQFQRIASTNSFPVRPVKTATQELYREAMLKAVMTEERNCVIIVDEAFHLLDTYGPYKRYLIIPEEGFTNEVLRMVPQRAATILTLCLRKVQSEGELSSTSIELTRDDKLVAVNAQISAVHDNMAETEQRYVVVFRDILNPIEAPPIEVNESNGSSKYIEELEQELKNTQGFLQATIEDLQASNEELQTTNEELLSSNEELQSTYEEMQSVNEELHTVNAEYQVKNKELSTLNADMGSLLNSTEVAVLFLDDKECIRKFTPAVKGIFHLRDVDIGRPIKHFLPNLQDDAAQTLMDFIGQKSSARVAFDAKTSEGKWLHIAVVPFMENDEATGKVISFVNVQELKEAQSQLEDKTMALEYTLESTLAGYWDWYIQEDREYMSPTFKSMFGYEDHEIPNRPDAWQKIIHPDDLPRVQEIFDEHVKSKGAVPYDNEVRYYHKNGSIVWVWCRGKVIEWDKDYKPVRMVGSHVNITALKQAEEALVTQARDAQQFSYVAAHDLREPINTIRNYLNLLQSQDDLVLTDMQNSLMQYVYKASERLALLVGDLLDYSRLQSVNFTLEAVDLNKIADDVCGDLAGMISKHNAKIEIESLPTLPANSNMVRQLFQNLIGNGVKFHTPGKVPHVKISAVEHDNDVEISFTDNGIGIAKKYQEQIFEVFKRLHTQEEYDGSGIGLAICQRIADIHGGQIVVDSRAKKGSTFKVILPKRVGA